ncbi:DNA-3-methyladenine glycosylase family protein [Virgibacillus pantothenticus]|uniref:DNA-3-methyladenine glycosylase II n=1 Tax=Virgibacillus pantothenticus TaxID=1473 RepID=A0A0L0QKR2_VIRPA|nr:DNA-3-methyladenine glycosylase [Virgibacillus pantothenticus]KNE19215.1 hypothetical protein AFK71_11810 [Virgibacillus pantothenticus]MED3738658.1 DNA-3-methyladenine glycosylase [Virgibacillus pantothenticus]QTY15678.1 DNA-3-methyladenine glycosylase 2 family protein [Virgibacillus pantothenticus]SIT16314.1 DNA-3-methyladenine glycosylase II [Virgibacillus pantothenticus]
MLIKKSISYPKDFSFNMNLNYLKSTEDGLFHTDHKSVKRFIVIDENPFFLKVYEYSNELVIDIEDFNQKFNEITENKIILYVRDWLDLDTNLTTFYDIAKNDEYLQLPLSKFYGLRNIGIPDIFEAFVWAILGQQINLTFATTLKDRFIKKYGKKINYDNEDYWLFPTASIIASESIDELFKLGMSRRKCEYIKEIARAIDNQKVSKEKLLQLSNIDEAVNTLTEIKGIGPWTANYVLLRCVRYLDAFPINDVGLHNAIKLVGGLDKKPSINEIKKIASSWKGYESYATFFLWRLIY